MKQTLIDKFEIAHGMNLSSAVLLNQALLELPDEVIGGEVDIYSHPVAHRSKSGIVTLSYTSSSSPNRFPVVFPKDAKNPAVNGERCSFKYNGIKYEIN